MALKEINLNEVALPGAGQGMSFGPIVKEFLDSGMKAAVIEDEDGRTFSTVLQGVRAYLSNHPDLSEQVKVTSRGGEKGEDGKRVGGTVILARRDALKNGGYTKAQIAEREAKAAGTTPAEAPEGSEAPAEATDGDAPVDSFVDIP